MKDIFDEIKENYDFIGLQNRTYTLARMEKRNSYDDFDANTKYCMEEMKRLGFSQVRRFTHKADGVPRGNGWQTSSRSGSPRSPR